MNPRDALPTDEYRCPGQKHTISRAVHLGRLAAFDPACRSCPHREETGTLSPRQVERLEEVAQKHRPRPLFHNEGAGGVYWNDLAPATVRDIAAAFGAMLRNMGRGARGEGRGIGDEKPGRENESFTGPSFSDAEVSGPSVLLAGDGRSLTAELVAAASEGLRSSGCEVVDLGQATAACLAFAVDRFRAAGGLLVGNAGQQPHEAGLKFWLAGPRPLSAGGSLEPLVELFESQAVRPARRYGPLRRQSADEAYLAALASHYHAIRPLRVLVDSASGPWLDYFGRLAAAVECRIIPCHVKGESPLFARTKIGTVPCRASRQEICRRAVVEAAHFAVSIDGDGETCHVVDERGRGVAAERILFWLASGDEGGQSPSRPVVLESSASKTLVEQFGPRAVVAGPRRAEMTAAMREHRAAWGGGPSGRIWHAEHGFPSLDALMVVTRMLELLSRGDEPLSALLDREAPRS